MRALPMSTSSLALALVLLLTVPSACSDADPGSGEDDAGTLGFPAGDVTFMDVQAAPGEPVDTTNETKTPDGSPTPDTTEPVEDTTVTTDSSEPPGDPVGGDDSGADSSNVSQEDAGTGPGDAPDAGGMADADSGPETWTDVEGGSEDDACAWTEVDTGSGGDACAWTEVDTGSGGDACAWTEVDTGSGGDACAWTEVDTGSGGDACAWTEEDTMDDDCPVDLQQIFVITTANWLLRFEPETLGAVPLGMVTCPAGGATPFSMAVDREGYAWVLYSDGSLWKVNTGDASCQSTGFVSGQQGFTMFGMGFTADGPTSNTETLFISGGSMSMFMGETGSLGSITLPAMMVNSIAQFPIGPGSPELTGTRFGELWGFFAMSSPSHVSRINKQTSALEKTWPLPNNLQGPEAWAFAHWGGDFYLFFKAQGGFASGVFHLDGLTGATTEVVPNLGHTITGAGVSICAPAQ